VDVSFGKGKKKKKRNKEDLNIDINDIVDKLL
jgi:hypothetical protein